MEGSGIYNQIRRKNNDSYLMPVNVPRDPLLEWCCKYGAVKCFKYLITEFNLEITSRCLQLSFLGGNADIMRECLKYQTPDGICMKYAIISQNIDFVLYLMNTFNIQILPDECSQFLFLQGFLIYLDQTKDFKGAFYHLLLINFPPLYDYLILCGANVNEPYHLFLDILKNSYTETAKLFITKGAKVNGYGNFCEYPLCTAVTYNNIEITKLLISYGAEINRNGSSYGEGLLCFAVQHNFEKIAEILLLNGVNNRSKDGCGKTTLSYAIENKNIYISELLILHGSDVNFKDYKKKSLIHYAIETGMQELVKL